MEKEEIIHIFSDAIDAIMQGDTPTLNVEGNTMMEADDIDYSDDEAAETEDSSDVPEVILGCKVVIRNADKETKTYKYDLINGVLPKVTEVFTGHKVGDIIELMGKEWKIEDVILWFGFNKVPWGEEGKRFDTAEFEQILLESKGLIVEFKTWIYAKDMRGRISLVVDELVMFMF